MSFQTTYLITGANRGIGLGLTKAALSRPNTLVIAGVRDVASSSLAITSIPTATHSKVIVIKLDSTSETDATDAVKALETMHCISVVDVLIANAGICNYYGPAATTPIKEFSEHYMVNVVGVVSLFQAFLPLLEKSDKPKFVTMTSGAGSIGLIPNIRLYITAYGASKAALNYVTRKIHDEHPRLIAFPIHPGLVQTDMGYKGTKAAGMDPPKITLDESIRGLMDKIDNATRETGVSGLPVYDGRIIPY